MRTLYILLFSLVAWSIQAQQVPISLHIQHNIGSEPLEAGKIYPSIQGNFMVTRLSYYLSDIELIHDGGQRLAMKNLYLLVHGSEPVYDLGMADVQSIEGIAFNIGVDSVTNHADPALWPANHPLSYQNPSMHWGWVSGYRFLAIEGLLDGNQDGNPEKIWEFHVVGDELLTHVEVMLDSPQPIALSSEIHLTADYLKLFDGVSMDNVLHGSGSLITKMMGNWNKGPVFVGVSLVSSIDPTDPTSSSILQVQGNPSAGMVQIRYTAGDRSSRAEIRLLNASGQQVASEIVGGLDGQVTFSLPAQGHYIAVLMDGQRVIDVKQVIGL